MLRVERKNLTGSRLPLRLLSVAAALVAAGLFILLCGYNPFQVYSAMVTGALSNSYYISQTVEKMVPLTVMALGVAVCFKMKFINIGSEGQFCMGAMGATYVALFMPSLPVPIAWILMFLAAFLCGGVWCLIAGALKAKWRVSDTLVTLMLNYIAIKIVSFLQHTAWKDPASFGYPKIANYPKALQLKDVCGAHAGWIVAAALVFLVWFLLKRTKLGYEISVMGDTAATAKYAGMNTTKILLLVSLIGGGICGLAGLLQASGAEHTLNDSMSGGMGYTAIVIAYMAGMDPFGIVAVSFLFSILLQGSAFMQISMQIPVAAADVIQGIILLFVLGCEFFTNYRISLVRRAGSKGGV